MCLSHSYVVLITDIENSYNVYIVRIGILKNFSSSAVFHFLSVLSLKQNLKVLCIYLKHSDEAGGKERDLHPLVDSQMATTVRPGTG